MKNKQIKIDLLESGKYYQIQQAKYKCYKNDKNYKLNSFLPGEIVGNVLNNSISAKIKLYFLINKNGLYQEYKKVSKYVNCNFREYKESENLRKSKSKQRQEIKNQLMFWVLMGYKIIFNTYTLNEYTFNKYNPEIEENIDKIQSKLTRILKDNTTDYIGNIDYGTKKGRLHFHVLEAYDPNGTHYLKEEINKTNNFNELDYICPFTNRSTEINELQEYKTRDKYLYKNLHINTLASAKWSALYGFVYPELIEYNTKSYNKLPSYLAKLCNHSIKVKKKRLFKKRISAYVDGQYTEGSLYKTYKYANDPYKNRLDLTYYKNKGHLTEEQKQKLFIGREKYKNEINSRFKGFKEEQYEMINILEQI